ncbi:hypothetical protein [Actinomadura parmotrematis]|uniref:Zinc-finger domain-containing protein n=1 Tax=Actinomadura parmotrematis TaxID=2864039 RepID=A0ABS7G5I7_9ACTN|nr:hypothetical protein [Actinomadura parmotrematis]MBW8487062.1 hypothetical protein [Actinomadura parmotrematis]
MNNPAHLDYDTLADLAEGLLADDRAASVNAHLDACADCRDRSADLADVSRLLAEAPVPAMPAELASRIDQAIAAESLNSAAVASLEQRRGRRHWRILSAAAATVAVLGGGAVVAQSALQNGGDGAAHVPASDAGRAAPLNAAAFTVEHSGTDYRAGDVARQVGALLGTLRTAELRTQGGQAAATLLGCVEAVTRGRTPELVDQARYQGAPATVIAAPGASGVRDIWVVGADCTPQRPHVLAHTTASRG